MIGVKSEKKSNSFVPLLVVAVIGLILYLPVMLLANYGPAQKLLSSGAELDCTTALECAFQMRNPVVPAPMQLWDGFKNMSLPPLEPTSVPYNLLVTAGETLLGLLLASVTGLLLAVLLVSSRAFERSVLPWLVASQTIPIVAVAPMLAVLLGQYGVQGWVPKALIAAFIAFFPICIGLAKGLRSPDPLSLDLMNTYHASRVQIFLKLRFPASVPYLFTALKVSAAAALVGSIVAEISSISFSGLGKMLAENSRASDGVALWVIMIYGAVLGIVLVALINWLERVLTPWQRKG